VAAEEQNATTMEINHNIQQITDVANLTAASSHEEAAAQINWPGFLKT